VYIAYNITILLSFHSVFNDRPNGGITEYLLYDNNQVVYRGKNRQHNITGKEKSARYVFECVCAVVCAVAETVERRGLSVKRRGKVEKSKMEMGD